MQNVHQRSSEMGLSSLLDTFYRVVHSPGRLVRAHRSAYFKHIGSHDDSAQHSQWRVILVTDGFRASSAAGLNLGLIAG